MRKSLGVSLAMALLMSMVAIGAGPASAAGGTTCTKLVGVVGTITPGLPPLSSSALVTKVVTKASGSFAGCTGGGVTAGKFSLASTPSKTPGNCKTLLQPDKSGPTAGTGSITWTPKGSSTFSFKLLKTTPPSTSQVFSAKITGGLFKGLTATQKFTFTAVPKTGCVSTPLSKVTVAPKTPLVIK